MPGETLRYCQNWGSSPLGGNRSSPVDGRSLSWPSGEAQLHLGDDQEVNVVCLLGGQDDTLSPDHCSLRLSFSSLLLGPWEDPDFPPPHPHLSLHLTAWEFFLVFDLTQPGGI